MGTGERITRDVRVTAHNWITDDTVAFTTKHSQGAATLPLEHAGFYTLTVEVKGYVTRVLRKVHIRKQQCSTGIEDSTITAWLIPASISAIR
jgi:hypothetical protein